VIILSATTYGSDSTVTGEAFKGDGYYGRSDGFHTVAWNLTGFTGTIKIQGSLATSPGSNDWFDVRLGSGTVGGLGVDTTGAVSSASIMSQSYTTATTVNSYNFTGNIVWVRAVITDFAAGTVNSIYMNS
jgi:hypothetical protein